MVSEKSVFNVCVYLVDWTFNLKSQVKVGLSTLGLKMKE